MGELPSARSSMPYHSKLRKGCVAEDATVCVSAPDNDENPVISRYIFESDLTLLECRPELGILWPVTLCAD